MKTEIEKLRCAPEYWRSKVCNGRGVIFHQKNMGISMVIFLIIKLLYV